MMTVEEIINIVNEEDVEFVRLQFTDMLGLLKNVAVTSGHLEKILSNKFRIDTPVLFNDNLQPDEDLYLFPILESFTILPWRPQQGKVAKLMCDVCYQDGTPYELYTRTILKKVVDSAKEAGYRFLIHPECEFFLFHTDDDGLPTTITHEQAGFMDVGPVDLGENARRDIVLNLEEMGFDIESSHHEKAPAQHEIDFKEASTLHAADAIMSFKFAVRSIAKRFGLYATFMPKPREDVAGSGMHINISILKDEKNVSDSDNKESVTDASKQFIAGVMKHAKGMCLYTNSIVNSYKRLNNGFEAPGNISWSARTEDGIVRLRQGKSDSKIEIRFPDPSANPYLALAVIIAAGMDGIEQKYEMVDEGEVCGKLPEDLKEAVMEAKNDSFIRSIIGEEFATLFESVKKREWDRYVRTVSEWEISHYLYRI